MLFRSQASLTGHLVLSTLHTNDAPSAITRLLDMGVEPYLVSSSVIAVVAQRLVRKVCTFCAKESKWDGAALQQEAYVLKKNTPIMRGSGCERCRFTGYQGRVAIYEILPFTDAIRELALKKASAEVICQTAVQEGMSTLFEEGLERVYQGLTTPEEVFRVVSVGSR